MNGGCGLILADRIAGIKRRKRGTVTAKEEEQVESTRSVITMLMRKNSGTGVYGSGM